MSKIIKKDEILDLFQDGMTIMAGGFLECGAAGNLLDLVVEEGIKDITLIVNDTGFADKKIGNLITQKCVKKVIASHIGTNSETRKQLMEEEIEVNLIPQGTLVERIRCRGAGLGGVLTPTGIGTIVADGKEVIEVNEKKFLLELPLAADLALIKTWKADELGNLVYSYSARNFNPIMAMAADRVLVEAEEIVPSGALNPNEVMTPGVFVDYIVDFS